MAEHKFYLTNNANLDNLAGWAPGWDGAGSASDRFGTIPAADVSTMRHGFLGQANAGSSEAPRSEYVAQFYVDAGEIPLGPIEGEFATAVPAHGIYYPSGDTAVPRAVRVIVSVVNSIGTRKGVIFDQTGTSWSNGDTRSRTVGGAITPGTSLALGDRVVVEYGGWIGPHPSGAGLYDTTVHFPDLSRSNDGLEANISSPDVPFVDGQVVGEGYNSWFTFDLVDQTPPEPVPSVTSRYYLLDPPSFTIGTSGGWTVSDGPRQHLTSTVPVHPLATNSTSAGEQVGGGAATVHHRSAVLPPILHEGTVEGASFRMAMAFYNSQNTSATMRVVAWLRSASGTNKGVLGEFFAPKPVPGGTTRYVSIAEGDLPSFEAEPGDRVAFDIGMWMNNTTALTRSINSPSWMGDDTDMPYEQEAIASTRPWIEFTAPQAALPDPDADVARYYFDPFAVPAVSPAYSPDWLITTVAQRRSLRLTHFVGANGVDLSAVSESGPGTSVMLGRQYVGGTVPEGPIRGRLRSALRATSQFSDLAEDRIRVIARVVSADGTVVRGTLCDTMSAVEVPGPSNIGTVTVEASFIEGLIGQPGDLLTVEFGAVGSLNSSTNSGTTLHLGGQSSDAADYPFSDGVAEAGLYPWVELAFDPPPPSPTALTQTGRTFTSVSAAFSPPVGPEIPDSYEYRVDGGAPVSLGASTSLSVSDLTHTTAYEVEVRAIYGSTPSAWTTVVATTRTVYPPTIWVIPGPEGNEPWAAPHHGRFRIADFGEFSGYVSLGIKVSADRSCYLTIFARWSRWVEGVGFEPVGVDQILYGPSSVGDDSGQFLYRAQIFLHQRAPEGATHWQPVLRGTDDPDAVSGLATGTKVRFDDLYVPDNGYRIDREPYLDGDQPKGRWEGPRAASTSVYGPKVAVPLAEIITIEPELLVPDDSPQDLSDLTYLDDDMNL